MSVAEVIDLRAERRALIWLVAGIGLQLCMQPFIWAGIDLGSKTAVFVYRVFWACVALLPLGAVASLMHARRSGLGVAALGCWLAAYVTSAVLPFARALLDVHDALDPVHAVVASVMSLGLVLAVWDATRPARGWLPLALAGLASAAVAAVVVVQNVMDSRARREGVGVDVLVIASRALPLAVFVWRLVTMPRVTPTLPEDHRWQAARGGVRLVRVAVIGQLVVTIALAGIGVIASGTAALWLFVLAALALLVFAFTMLSGLGGLRRIPSAADAGGPFSAAWAFHLAGLCIAIGVAALLAARIVSKTYTPHDLLELVTRFQVALDVLGLGVAVALFNGARRVGRALEDRSLAGRALASDADRQPALARVHADAPRRGHRADLAREDADTRGRSAHPRQRARRRGARADDAGGARARSDAQGRVVTPHSRAERRALSWLLLA